MLLCLAVETQELTCFVVLAYSGTSFGPGIVLKACE